MQVDIFQVGNGRQYVAVRQGDAPPAVSGKNLKRVKSLDTSQTDRIGIDMPKLVEDIEAHGFHAWSVVVQFNDQ